MTDRLRHRDELNDEISEITKTNTSKYWFDRLSEGGVPCGPVNTIDKMFADEQVRHVGMTMTAQHDKLGELIVVAQPNNIEGVEKRMRMPPPALGEHTEAVLRSLDYSDQEIADLKARNVV